MQIVQGDGELAGSARATSTDADADAAAEVIRLLGGVPPLLASAQERGVLAPLWAQAKQVYLNSPIPVSARIMVMAYLGRWSASPNLMVTNLCHLHSGGVQADRLFDLVATPGPSGDPQEDAELAPLLTGAIVGWPRPGSRRERAIVRAAAWCYTRRPGYERVQDALRAALTESDHAHFVGLLGWVGTWRAWTDAHPDLELSDHRSVSDVLPVILDESPQLARYLDMYRDIVALEDAEAAGERLAALVEHVSDMIVVLERDGTVRYASPAAARMLGHRVEDFIGTNGIDLVHPDDLITAAESLQRTVELGGERPPLQFRLRKADGSYLECESRANNRVHDPQIRGLVMTIRDISERLEVEHQLRDAEERFRVAFEEAPIAMAIIGLDGSWLKVNAEMCALVDATEEEMLAGTVSDTSDPADLEEDVALALECLAGKRRTYSLHKAYKHKSRGVVYAQTWVALIRDQDGAPMYFLSQSQDVTARMRDEAALRAAESQFRMAFDHAPVGMALVDRAGIVSEVNDALCLMLATSEAALIGVDLAELAHADERDDIVTALSRLSAGNDRTYRAESRFVASGDRLVWGHLSIAPTGASEPGENFIVQIEDITDRKEAENALLHQTLHDSLTGLPNRLLLRDRLEQALARRRRMAGSVAVLFIDLDRFKLVNDSLGHEAGDRVLIEVGRRLSGIARRADTIARIGGDEFVVLAEDLNGEDDAIALAERVREVIGLPLHASGTDLRPSASIGIAMVTELIDAPDQLLRAADTAMYQAKERGRDRYEVYNTSLLRRAQLRMEVEGDLRQALDDNSLYVHYQPIVELATGRVVSVEALVRLSLPGGRRMQPTEFMQVAEDTGLIVPIGQWVLREALAQQMRWRGTLGDAAPAVCVNVSARQICLPDFVDHVLGALGEAGAPAAALGLELTESILLEATRTTTDRLEALRQEGMSLGIDDFGTGYSSLTYLRRFPVDFVKVDRSFVAGVGASSEDEAIVRAVVSLGGALGLRTVAEGVESAEHMAFLDALGCDQVQGYFVAPPMEGDELHKMLTEP